MNQKKFRRNTSHKAPGSLNQLILGCLVTAIILVFMIMLASGDNYDDFRDDLGMRESSDNYAAVNRFHYMGRYQLGSLALQDIGFQDQNGAWTDLAKSYGISSEQDFLNAPDAQDAIVTIYHKRLCSYIRANDLDDYIGTTYCGVKVTKSGLLAACHLVGIGSLIRGLESGQAVYDGNGVSAAEYMELFAGYNISKVWQD